MKTTLTNIYHCLVDYDPGLVRFKQGFKSVLALCFSLVFIYFWVNPLGLILASLACVFTGLMHSGASLKQQKCHMLGAVLYFPAAIALGLSLQNNFWLANAVLVLLSYLGFYLAKFGSRFRLYPVVGAIFYLLSINIMVPGFMAKLLIVLAVLIGALIMFMSYFYIWPENPKTELGEYIKGLCNRMINCIESLKMGVGSHKPALYYDQVMPLFTDLERRLDQEFQILDRYDKSQQPLLESLIVKQYALFMLFYMMLSWLKELSFAKQFDEPHRDQVVLIFSHILAAIGRLKQLTYCSSTACVIDAEFKDSVSRFKERVFNDDSIAGPSFIYYSYLAFGFERAEVLLGWIQEHVQELELSGDNRLEQK